MQSNTENNKQVVLGQITDEMATRMAAIAARRKTGVTSVAEVFLGLGESLGLNGLRSSVEKLSVEGQWHALARGTLRDELYSQHRSLAGRVLEAFPNEKDPLKKWLKDNAVDVERVSIMLNNVQSQVSTDYAVVSIAVRSLDQLLLVTESS